MSSNRSRAFLSACAYNVATVAVLLYILGLSAGYRHHITPNRRGLTKGQEEIGPIDNFTCPGDGAFPHSEDCTLFITCWNGSAILHRCTEIMLYDLRYNGCNWAEYVDCGDRHRPPTYPGTTTPPTTSTSPDPSASTVSTGPTTPRPNGTFECPADGVFPHAEKCEYYWSCWNGTAELIHCELDYLFDLKYNGCNFPELTDCGDRERPIGSSTPVTVTTTESSGSTNPGNSSTPTITDGPSSSTREPGGDYVCPEPDGLFPDPEDCGAYYSCETNIPTQKLCPEGLHFSPEKQICDWPETAGCE